MVSVLSSGDWSSTVLLSAFVTQTMEGVLASIAWGGRVATVVHAMARGIKDNAVTAMRRRNMTSSWQSVQSVRLPALSGTATLSGLGVAQRIPLGPTDPDQRCCHSRGHHDRPDHEEPGFSMGGLAGAH